MKQPSTELCYCHPALRGLCGWKYLNPFRIVIGLLLCFFVSLNPGQAGPAPDQKSPAKTDLLSNSQFRPESASVVLGEPEMSEGLGHLKPHWDGKTAAGVKQELPCHFLDLDPEIKSRKFSMGYFYFVIDPAFKARDVQRVRIEVEYFSETGGEFGIDYDALGNDQGKNLYKRAKATVQMNKAKEWQRATFHIVDAAFENSQHGGADFRIWARPPELFVHRVTITKETTPAR